MRATAWAAPTKSAWPRVMEASGSFLVEYLSASHIIRDPKASVDAMRSGLRKAVSTIVSNFIPTTTAGMVASPIYHMSLASCRAALPLATLSVALPRLNQSRRKYHSTAASVPTCSETSKARLFMSSPCQPVAHWARIRWPELLIGRNSVRPCIMPRIIASIIIVKIPCHNVTTQVKDRDEGREPSSADYADCAD